MNNMKKSLSKLAWDEYCSRNKINFDHPLLKEISWANAMVLPTDLGWFGWHDAYAKVSPEIVAKRLSKNSLEYFFGVVDVLGSEQTIQFLKQADMKKETKDGLIRYLRNNPTPAAKDNYRGQNA